MAIRRCQCKSTCSPSEPSDDCGMRIPSWIGRMRLGRLVPDQLMPAVRRTRPRPGNPYRAARLASTRIRAPRIDPIDDRLDLVGAEEWGPVGRHLAEVASGAEQRADALQRLDKIGVGSVAHHKYRVGARRWERFLL